MILMVFVALNGVLNVPGTSDRLVGYIYILCCLQSWDTSTKARLSKENVDSVHSPPDSRVIGYSWPLIG